jgi:hypothetical protein
MKRTLHSARQALASGPTSTVGGEEVRAFVPPTLLFEPRIERTGPRLGALEAVNRALSRPISADTSMASPFSDEFTA